MYRVIQDLTVKVGGTIKTFPVGAVIKLPENAATMFVSQGKIRPIISRTDNGICCSICGGIAERYALSMDKSIRWGWFCLKCRPYSEPERN